MNWECGNCGLYRWQHSGYVLDNDCQEYETPTTDQKLDILLRGLRRLSEEIEYMRQIGNE